MVKEILAADIGGTSSRFARFRHREGEDLELVQSVWIDTKSVKSFHALLKNAEASDLKLQFQDFDVLVFAAAGPVEGGSFCSPPLIDWDIDLSTEGDRLPLDRTLLINDFLAQALACRALPGQEAREILPGEPDSGGAIATVGAGTGLGKAVIIPSPQGMYIPAASEGGHANFAPETEEEFRFCSFVRDRKGTPYATWDDIVSGKGLSLTHEFLSGERLSPEEVSARFDDAPETLEWAARFFGRVCRNYALEILCTGGLYIAGGVAAQNPHLLTHEAFASTFHRSATHGDILEKIPVLLMTNRESGLWGAALYGVRMKIDFA